MCFEGTLHSDVALSEQQRHHSARAFQQLMRSSYRNTHLASEQAHVNDMRMSCVLVYIL
jgi:hypothetical protein